MGFASLVASCSANSDRHDYDLPSLASANGKLSHSALGLTVSSYSRRWTSRNQMVHTQQVGVVCVFVFLRLYRRNAHKRCVQPLSQRIAGKHESCARSY